MHLYGRLNNRDGVVFQVVKNVDMSNAIMLDARLGNVLAKETAELEGFLVEEDEVRSKRLDLLLLRSTVDQSRIVSKATGENLFGF